MAEDAGRAQPLCALWTLAALPSASAALASSDRSALRLAERLGARRLSVAPGVLLNVNAPADLVRARGRLGG